MKRFKEILMLVGAATMVAGGPMYLASCGDDGGSTVKKKKPKPRARARGKGKKKGKASAAKSLTGYAKVPETLRRKFLEEDFLPDPTGDKNRDPFRSYVINVIADPSRPTGDDGNDVCSESTWMADNISIRNLTLIGIVMRGTRGFGLFRDGAGRGYIVTRRNCLGSEKALVTNITTGVVTLEIAPEPATAGAATQTKVRRDIPLYAKELDPTKIIDMGLSTPDEEQLEDTAPAEGSRAD